MTRLIVILLLIFIVLTIIRNYLKRIRNNPPGKFNSNQAQNIKKEGKQGKDDNIVDAKFEELK